MIRGNQDPLVRRRRLRVALREARQRRGLSQKEAAVSLDWSPSKLLRIESGAVSVDVGDLKWLLQLYEVTDENYVKELVSLAREARRSTPWAAYRDIFHPEFAAFLGYEGASSLIRQFQPTGIPGLLQTEEYADAMIRALDPGAGEDVIRRAVQARMERQELLHRADPPQLFFILDETAVRRKVGKGRAMTRQLEHLRDVGTLPHVSIQIVPFEGGAYSCMRGAFVVLEFPDPNDDDLLYLENDRGQYIIRENKEEIASFTDIFIRLEEVSTSRDRLPEAIDALVGQLSGAGLLSSFVPSASPSTNAVGLLPE